MNNVPAPSFTADRVAGLQPVVHGSVSAIELARFGLTPTDVLDFSVNTNPLGPARSVLGAVKRTVWSRYPGDDESPLRAALARASGLTPEHVALGNGSAEVLWLLCLATLGAGACVQVIGPTFGEYARAARVMGARVMEVASLLDVRPGGRIVFLCNPNNPTAEHQHQGAVEQVLAQDPARLVVVDEAYATFDPRRWDCTVLQKRFPNLVIVRSMTKDHAIPGLRLGYALAAPGVAHAIEAVRPPWSVNAGALSAGLAALEPAARAHVRRAQSVVTKARALLSDGFTSLGYMVYPSSANFVLVEVGNGSAFRAALLPRGLVVRDSASFGLPGHVRVACRIPDDCRRLLNAVGDLGTPDASG